MVPWYYEVRGGGIRLSRGHRDQKKREAAGEEERSEKRVKYYLARNKRKISEQ